MKYVTDRHQKTASNLLKPKTESKRITKDLETLANPSNF